MNDIRPFRGLRFDEEVAGPLASLLCPPYDVISPSDQLALYAKSPNNMIRLELGLQYPEDDGSGNRYTRATATLERWLAEGVLKEDEPALYLYEQRFSLGDVRLARLGVLARLRLTPWEEGVVLPHEETMSGPKEDRLRLMRSTAANLSPVFLLFDDPSGSVRGLMDGVTALPPWEVAQTDDGQEHRLWVVKGELAGQMAKALGGPQLFMADGHHRYETALAYRKEMIAADPSTTTNTGIDFVMALMVDARDPGLVVLPTHRLIHGVDEARIQALADALERWFEVEPIATEGTPAEVARALIDRIREAGQGDPTLGMYAGGLATLLRLRDHGSLPQTAGRPALDVDVLHGLVLERLLGIGEEELRTGEMVGYTRDPAEAAEAVDRGSSQVAFFLNPTPVEQILATARAGGRMPQKSTYFYPKPETGLVMNPLWT